jgi:hypothetical protein
MISLHMKSGAVVCLVFQSLTFGEEAKHIVGWVLEQQNDLLTKLREADGRHLLYIHQPYKGGSVSRQIGHCKRYFIQPSKQAE